MNDCHQPPSKAPKRAGNTNIENNAILVQYLDMLDLVSTKNAIFYFLWCVFLVVIF